MRRSFFTYFLGVIAVAALSVLVYYVLISSTKADLNDGFDREVHKNYRIYSPIIPDSLWLAGEKVPLKNPYVREALDKELIVTTYRHSSALLYLKRANRYFPIIEKIFKEEGIPDDLKYIVIAESGLSEAVSPKGASGYWQFMKTTAKSYDLEINEYVDERYHFEKSTRAACKYLKEAYKKFGSWTLAAASYNMGRSGLSKRITAHETDDFYALYLNKETSRYIFRILAIKLVMENPVDYGFRLREKDLYHNLPVKELKVDSTITNLYKFAQDNGTTYRLLKYHNPWLRNNKLINKKGKTYTIVVPDYTEESYQKLIDESDTKWIGNFATDETVNE